MSFEFGLPNFSVETASERRLYSYLYQTVQQLNWAMKHIGASESGGYLPQSPAASGKGSGKTAAETFQEIKALIIKSADIVESYSEKLKLTFDGAYLSQSEFGSYAEKTDQSIEANSQSIRQQFESMQLLQTNVQRLLEANAYIKTGFLYYDEAGLPVYGLEIGQTGEVDGEAVFHKFARFSSSRLSFFDQNDTEIAYISDFRLYITNAHITGSLTLGDYELDTSDGLAFRWMGGETG